MSYPLDVIKFAEDLGFEVKYKDTGNADGCTIIINGKKVIILNKFNGSIVRKRFTLAHELGHYFIPSHLDPIYSCKVNELVYSHGFKNKNPEREADVFASELLLPSKNLNYNVKDFESIISVAGKYQVSIQAAAIKLVEKSDNHICFICCKDDKVKWYVESHNFKDNLKLKNIRNVRIPENSLFNTHKNDLKYPLMNKGRVSACVWLDEVELSDFVDEEFLYNINYNSVYILIDAEPLFKYEC